MPLHKKALFFSSKKRVAKLQAFNIQYNWFAKIPRIKSLRAPKSSGFWSVGVLGG